MTANDSNPLRDEVYALADQALHGDAGGGRELRLLELVAASSEARREYLQFIHDALCLRELAEGGAYGAYAAREATPAAAEDPSSDAAQTNAAVVAPASRFRAFPVVGRKPLRVSLGVAAVAVTLMVAVMALLTVPLLQRAPTDLPPAEAPFVARIGRGVGQVWNGTERFREHTALVQGQQLSLREGFVEVYFYGGARVLLDGPAQFQVLDGNRGKLQSGKLVARVPKPASGFTIVTPRFEVVDIGTEFGVEVKPDNTLEVEVFQGSIDVYEIVAEKDGASPNANGGAGQPPARDKSGQRVVAGEGLRFTPHSNVPERFSGEGEAGEPAKARSGFVRELPRTDQRVLRLADIVGGGDGLGTGRDAGINVATGKLETEHAESVPGARPNVFRAVDELPFVDGVFIPHGGVRGEAAIPISSTGLTATGVAPSAGATYDHLWNGFNLGVSIGTGGPEAREILGMHTAKGITFDLQAIRQAHAEFEIAGFQATAVTGDRPGKAHFYVFLDGRKAKELLLEAPNRAKPLSVAIDGNVRFLTLMTLPADVGVATNWSMLDRPRLLLQKKLPAGDAAAGDAEQPAAGRPSG